MKTWYVLLLFSILASSELVSGAVTHPPSPAEPRLRLIHHPQQPPDRLITLSSLFGDVQTIALTTRLAPAVAAAPDCPTVVVVRSGVTRRSRGWYRALYGMRNVTVLHYGQRPLRDDLPASWTVVRCRAGQQDAAAGAVQRLLGAAALTQATPRRKGTKRHRPSSS